MCFSKREKQIRHTGIGFWRTRAETPVGSSLRTRWWPRSRFLSCSLQIYRQAAAEPGPLHRTPTAAASAAVAASAAEKGEIRAPRNGTRDDARDGQGKATMSSAAPHPPATSTSLLFHLEPAPLSNYHCRHRLDRVANTIAHTRTGDHRRWRRQQRPDSTKRYRGIYAGIYYERRCRLSYLSRRRRHRRGPVSSESPPPRDRHVSRRDLSVVHDIILSYYFPFFFFFFFWSLFYYCSFVRWRFYRSTKNLIST